MKRVLSAALLVALATSSITSCTDKRTTETKESKPVKSTKPETIALSSYDPAIGVIETEAYVLKLHRAFTYEPKGAEILAGTKPMPGHKFIYLDVSLLNNGVENIDGSSLFIALRVTDLKGTEYKKPGMALASYIAEHPEETSDVGYNALWETLVPGAAPRALVYAVEVPANEKDFILHIPTDKKRKEWKTMAFTI